MRSILLLFFYSLISMFSIAQAPAIAWQKSLGGTGTDEAKSVQPTSDGGYIVGGTTSSNDGDVSGNHGGMDCWVVKLNAAGNIEWQKTFGGTGDEIFGSIRVAADGGYIMAASTASNNGDVSGNHGARDSWVVKLNNTGNIEWQKCFGSTGYDGLNYIEETLDGGYICMGTYGTNNGDLEEQASQTGGSWLFKLSGARAIQWQKASSNDVLYAIRQTSDRGYVYCGYLNGIIGAVFINKIDSAGNNVGYDQWAPLAPGMYQSVGPRSVVPTDDGGCVTIYENDSYYSGNPVGKVVKKYKSNMVAEWTTQVTGVTGYVNSMTKAADGGYLLAGTVNQSSTVIGLQGGQDYWLAKLDSTGTLKWQRALGSAGNDNGFWAESAADGSYIIAGKAVANSGDITGNHGGDDFWVAKLPSASPGFAIISSAGDNGTISPNGGNIYPAGSNQTFRITPGGNGYNYHIADVLVDGVSNLGAISSGTYTFTNIQAAHSISATFAFNTYTLVASAGANGSVSPSDSLTVDYGSNKTYNITPVAGYSILDLLVDSVSVGAYSPYSFLNISANHTINATFTAIDSASVFVCPPVDSSTITANLTGTNFRWQLNNGNGYRYLVNDDNFGGTSTASLTIRYYQQPLLYKHKYRCIVDGVSSSEFTLKFKDTWTSGFDNHWEIANNWSCGKVPDANTDVVIPDGQNLVISSNVVIRSLSISPASNITVSTGYNLTILH